MANILSAVQEALEQWWGASTDDLSESLEETLNYKGNIPLQYGNLSDDDLSIIRLNYRENMLLKREYEYILPENNFIRHMRDTSYYQRGDSYIFGNEIGDPAYFIPSHFAPASRREWFELIKELSQYDNVLFSILDDMVSMLERSGFHYTWIKRPKPFGWENVEKHIMVSDKRHFHNNILGLIEYYMQNEGEAKDIDRSSRNAKVFLNEFTPYQQKMYAVLQEEYGIERAPYLADVAEVADKYNLPDNFDTR